MDSRSDRPQSAFFVDILNDRFFELAYRDEEGFLILNDDCLENILKYLKDEDLENFALAHPRILHIVLRQSPQSLYFEKLSDFVEFVPWLKENLNLFLDFSNDFWIRILWYMNYFIPKADFIFFANASPRIRKLALETFPDLVDEVCALDCGEGILILNDYCLEKILKYVIYNCELTEDYTDLINFGMAHPRIKNMALDLEPFLDFADFCKKSLYLDTIDIDFNDCYRQIVDLGSIKKIQFWSQILFKCNRETVKTCTLRYYVEESLMPDYVEYFQRVMNVLNPDLEDLRIYNVGYSVDNLHRFTRLRKLTISGDISADVLVECCKANPDLEIINLMRSSIYGKLADIVPYCNKLLDLSVTVKENAVEYVPLAKLPHLKYLWLYGQHDIGSLQQVFRAFASKEPQIVRKLFIEPLINYDETYELTGIRSLSILDYRYYDTRSLIALSQLNNLVELNVENTHKFQYEPVTGNEIIEAFLIILQMCPKLEELYLDWDIDKHFISNVAEVLKNVRDPDTQNPLRIRGYKTNLFITEKVEKIWEELYGKYLKVLLVENLLIEDEDDSGTSSSPPPADLYYD